MTTWIYDQIGMLIALGTYISTVHVLSKYRLDASYIPGSEETSMRSATITSVVLFKEILST